MTKLSKYLNPDKFNESEHILKEEYELYDNCDLMLSRADYLYIQCNLMNVYRTNLIKMNIILMFTKHLRSFVGGKNNYFKSSSIS